MADLATLRLLVNQPAWYGSRSGYYAQLPVALARLGHDIEQVNPTTGVAPRVVGKLWSALWRLPARRQTLTIDELRFHAGWLLRQRKIAVILAIEEHLPALSYWNRAPQRLIGTIHYPRALWTSDQAAMLAHLQSAIVLYRADLEFFERHVGPGRVRFVLHGVDTEYFCPGGEPSIGRPALLCVGQFGRDFDQLARVAPVILDRLAGTELVVVVATHAMPQPGLVRLKADKRVRILSGLSDGQLLGLYQRALLMLMPMTEAAANNALVESLACGLPIVTTNVGGVVDYGGGTLYPATPAGDDEALIGETTRLAEDSTRRREMHRSLRAFAVEHLSWPVVAAEHSRMYRELAALS